MVDEFITEILNTEDGARLGWPFARSHGGVNPKNIVFAPGVAVALKAHILQHESTHAPTAFQKKP